MKTIRQITTLLLLAACQALYAGTPPEVGSVAPNFKLSTPDGNQIELKQLLKRSPVVLLVLRGWPGYQCPICTRQVHDFIQHADDFRKQHAQVLMVYPGPNEQLKAHAREFLQDTSWPKEFLFVIDPDYTFTEQYGLRWDAENETAYPSAFIIGQDGKVDLAHVSKTHSGRLAAVDVLKSLKEQTEK